VTSDELLLQWASERGGGTWPEWKDAHRWATPADRDFGPSLALRTLSMLGHVEIAWEASRWTVAPPVLTLLPDAGGHGLLTGARTGALRERLDRELDHPDVLANFICQEDAPDACLVATSSGTALQELADWLEVPYEHSLGRRLAGLLPDLDAMLVRRESAPGVPDLGVEIFEATSRRWSPVENDAYPGLYRYERGWRKELRWKDDHGQPYHVDFALGVWCELRRLGKRSEMRWEVQSVHGLLGVPVPFPAPALHARAAAMCSGLAPMREGRLLMYRNVPKDVAEALASTLGQELVLVGLTETMGAS
jgi:hypothetical protein